ncbi:TipAS antibiotic-recognition domain-containing protein [Phytoactinopolyspora mesophila]|uniref:MerR family transcriptional regulator n=1 Tax=Phytoactinopolyspora mesophila TaxID=2650750 RepID=A0A7K3M4R1_9ACTN|nr:MerR family transcriptional regulator [Phytoactinopolyspora mesophila]
MSWSINEVAQLSGVTSRTLRHYDAIGLLSPAWTAHGGRRFYEQEQLLRLQRILLLRDLGLGLDSIAEVLAAQSQHGAVDVLQQHREWLLEERQRLGRLIKTVEDTIATLEEGGTMNPNEIYQGFENHREYEAEARQRWGDEAVDRGNAIVAEWTPEQWAAAKAEFDAQNEGLAQLMDAGTPVADEQVQAIIERHYNGMTQFWTPDRESYTGLGQMYVDDDRFAQNYEAVRPGLAAYLRDAIAVYAENRLS